MLAALLSKGFLPQELPPLFSSTTLANIVGQAGLTTAFTAQKAPWTQAVQHNLARAGGLRRRLTIPNPVNYYRLSSAFQVHAPALVTHWAGSPFSKTTPDPTTQGPRAIARKAGDRAVFRTKARVGARYLLRADIAQFYPSIYTHSIPWSLHTKAVAKAQIKDLTLAGNILDRESQAGQFGQTKGVPIGPDTSLGIAELLLTPLDKALTSTCKIVGGNRFIDDIELTFRTLAEADHAQAYLEALLSEIELQINSAKTRIVELPDKIESSFVTDLRAHVPKSNGKSKAEWIDFFNRAFTAARSSPQDGVVCESHESKCKS